MEYLPAGFKFRPSHLELVYYLNRKIQGLSIPPYTVLTNYDEFLDPKSIDWSHVSYLNDHERFYFMKRTKMSKNGKRVKRSGKTGTWRAATVETEIFDHENRVVASMVQLDFRTFKGGKKSCKNSSKTRWIMHEYCLRSETFQEWVVCRIKNDAKEQIHNQVVAVGDEQNDDRETKRRRIEEEEQYSMEPSQELISSNSENLLGDEEGQFPTQLPQELISSSEENLLGDEQQQHWIEEEQGLISCNEEVPFENWMFPEVSFNDLGGDLPDLEHFNDTFWNGIEEYEDPGALFLSSGFY